MRILFALDSVQSHLTSQHQTGATATAERRAAGISVSAVSWLRHVLISTSFLKSLSAGKKQEFQTETPML